MSVRNPDSSGMPVVNKKCKLCTFVENRNGYLAGTYWRYIYVYYTIYATKKGPYQMNGKGFLSCKSSLCLQVKSRQGFAPCMNDYVGPILVGSGVHLSCYIDFRPTGTHDSHHSTCERLLFPPRDRTDARRHSRAGNLIISHSREYYPNTCVIFAPLSLSK